MDVWIIDDEPHIREVYTMLLKDFGFNVRNSNSLEFLEVRPEDVLVIDCGVIKNFDLSQLGSKHQIFISGNHTDRPNSLLKPFNLECLIHLIELEVL